MTAPVHDKYRTKPDIHCIKTEHLKNNPKYNWLFFNACEIGTHFIN